MSRDWLRLGGDASPYLKTVCTGLVLLASACTKQEPPAAPAAKPQEAAAQAKSASEAKPAPPVGAPPAAPAAGGATPAPATAAASPEFLRQGEELFKSLCAACHMADGSGVPFLQPSIKGSAWISNPDPQLLLSLILRGSAILGEASQAYENDMSPQSHLSDTEIAAVATYVRQRFAATPIAKPVTPAEVAVARARPGLPQ